MKYNTEIRRVLIGSISFVIIIIWLIVWQHQDTLLITSYIETQNGILTGRCSSSIIFWFIRALLYLMYLMYCMSNVNFRISNLDVNKVKLWWTNIRVSLSHFGELLVRRQQVLIKWIRLYYYSKPFKEDWYKQGWLEALVRAEYEFGQVDRKKLCKLMVVMVLARSPWELRSVSCEVNNHIQGFVVNC